VGHNHILCYKIQNQLESICSNPHIQAILGTNPKNGEIETAIMLGRVSSMTYSLNEYWARVSMAREMLSGFVPFSLKI
jgi:hypothetical protein